MKFDITATIDCKDLISLNPSEKRKVAVCCPVHPPKFPYLNILMDSFYRHNLNLSADFWVLFSNTNDSIKFTLQSRLFEKFLIMPKEIDTSNINAAVRKKLYAVHKLSEMGYDYIIILDADFIFVRTVNLEFICNKFWEEKMIISCNTQFHKSIEINTRCRSYFKNHPKINKIDVQNYSWLNQMWIYKCDTIPKFFEIIGDKDFNKFIWFDFEYIIYSYYLFLYENFREYLIPGWHSPIQTFGETPIFPENFSLDKVVGAHLMVCSKQMYFNIQANYPENEIILVTHLDR